MYVRCVSFNDMRLKAFATVYMFLKVFGFFIRSSCLVRDQRFGTACVSHHQGLNVNQRMNFLYNSCNDVTYLVRHVNVSLTC
jgi:hypothetical protein